ncbi:MAG: peptide MFS transporter [Novosphingobium sp.]|nr:peptide MFS transporter [Novosphingobium sp.]
MASAPAAIGGSDARELLGHPRGLLFLAFTETWERFSFYGMRALLVLYMVKELLLPGHIENVGGMGAYRSLLEGMFGPMSTQQLASQTFGFYAGLVYLTPLIGGLLADRWLGAKKTVMIGIALMTAGHAAMVLEESFLLALLLLILGSGCLKGNIAAQVGHLYPPHEETRRSNGFTIFSTGINIGAVAGPLACGLVAQIWGWHAGFGLAGAMMVLAALVYVAGLRDFADDTPLAAKEHVAPLTGAEKRMLGMVVFMLLLFIVPFLAYDQNANAGMIWIDQKVDLSTPFGPLPVAWIASVEPLVSILSVPLLMWLYQRREARGGKVDDFSRIALGAFLFFLSSVVMAWGDWFFPAGQVPVMVPLLTAILLGVGFIAAWPTMLAFVSRRAPAKVNAFMMAAVYLTAFASGVGGGFFARFYESLAGWQFWFGNSLFALAGVVLLLGLRPVLRRRMDAIEREIEAEAAAASA